MAIVWGRLKLHTLLPEGLLYLIIVCIWLNPQETIEINRSVRLHYTRSLAEDDALLSRLRGGDDNREQEQCAEVVGSEMKISEQPAGETQIRLLLRFLGGEYAWSLVWTRAQPIFALEGYYPRRPYVEIGQTQGELKDETSELQVDERWSCQKNEREPIGVC